jgi:hypothetical protein
LIATAILAVTLAGGADPYIRSRVDPAGPTDHCLYWAQNTTITWHAEQTGNPDTTGDTEFTAFEKSFATWNAQLTACASLVFAEGAKTASRTVGYDKTPGATQENILVFRFKTCGTDVPIPMSDACWNDDDCGNKYDCWQHNTSAIAITTTTYDPQSGRILDADIEYNSPSFVFTTVDTPICVNHVYNQGCVATDVQNTTTHEAGHMLGLAHTLYPGSTMNPTAPPGETSKRILDPGTLSFPCAAYPKGKPSEDCVIIAEHEPVALGPPKTGCSSAEGLMLPALLLLGRRRRAA